MEEARGSHVLACLCQARIVLPCLALWTVGPDAAPLPPSTLRFARRTLLHDPNMHQENKQDQQPSACGEVSAWH